MAVIIKNKSVVAAALCCGVALCITNPSWSANWFVDNTISASGNGASWSTAWRNFSNINWGSIHGGDTIYISGGNYYETLIVGASGLSGAPLTITKGVDPGHSGTVVIDGQNARGGVVLSSKNFVTIQNLAVQNGYDTAFSVKSATSGVILQNNAVYAASVNGNARGYDVRNSSDVIVRWNTYETPSSTTAQTDGMWSSANNGVVYDGNAITVSNNDGTGHSDCIQSYLDTALTIRNNFCWQHNNANNNHGLWLADAGGTLTVYNNVARMDNGQAGITYWNEPGYSGNSLLYNNTVYGATSRAFNLDNTPNTIMKNNIAYVTGAGRAVYVANFTPSSNNYGNNLVYVPNGGSVGYNANGFTGNPLFTEVANNDFHLLASSPAIDRGVTLSAITTDKDGTSRPQGAAYDIGAYEYKSSSQQGDSQPPSVPAGLNGSALSSSQINLTWQPSTDNVGVSGYDVYRNGTRIATATGTSHSDAGLSPSTIYNYAVDAYDAAGNISAPSANVAVSTPSAPPSGAFAIGTGVRTTTTTNVYTRDTSSSPIAGTQPSGATGTIVGGPARHSGRYKWQIDFVTGTDGWVWQNDLGVQ